MATIRLNPLTGVYELLVSELEELNDVPSYPAAPGLYVLEFDQSTGNFTWVITPSGGSSSVGTNQVQFSDGAGNFNTHDFIWEGSNSSISPLNPNTRSFGASGREIATVNSYRIITLPGTSNGYRMSGSGTSPQMTTQAGPGDGMTLWSVNSQRKVNIGVSRGIVLTDGALGISQGASDDVTLELVGNSILRLAGATAAVVSAVTPLEGMMAKVTTTDATFTSTGLWTYENGAWRKLEPVSTETFSSSAESNTSAPHTNWVNKISVNTSSLVAGNYKITLNYGWNHNATNSDFESRLSFDGTILGDVFGNGTTDKIEPKDSSGSGGSSGSSQQLSASRTFILTGIAAGVKAIVFDFRSDDASDLSTVWDAIIEIKRIP
ncbi:MAG: hypothetical protein COA88_12850 [Kordia sp.]|nr:MAG: hypothetical protein COA88_12850 [Kordia sp.]